MITEEIISVENEQFDCPAPCGCFLAFGRQGMSQYVKKLLVERAQNWFDSLNLMRSLERIPKYLNHALKVLDLDCLSFMLSICNLQRIFLRPVHHNSDHEDTQRLLITYIAVLIVLITGKVSPQDFQIFTHMCLLLLLGGSIKESK